MTLRSRLSSPRLRICAAVAAALALPSTPARAQATAQTDAGNAGVQALETVTVTARKRDERGQDVPQSLNVFTGTALEQAGVTTLGQLQYRTPGVAVVGNPGDEISIRGIANNASQRGGGPSTAVHFDGVYLPRPALAFGEVFDLNRVEVLKGPEGTLYGRNATAGVINFISRDPSGGNHFDGFIGAGSYDLRRIQAAGDLDAGDAAKFRVSLASTRDDGYTNNLSPANGRIDAQDFRAARVKGVFNITPNVDARLTVQFVEDYGNVGYGLSGNPNTRNFVNSLNPPQRRDPRDIQVDTPPDVAKRGTIVSAQVGADLGHGIQFKSITGYVQFNAHNLYDGDGTGGFIENNQSTDHSTFWSQEFQLSGGSPTALSWTTGLYFSREKTSGTSLTYDSNDYPVDLTPFTYSSQRSSASSHSEAVFGEATYAFNKQWSVTGGARYTREHISGDSSGGNIDFSTFTLVPYAGGEAATSSRFTPKGLVEFKPTDAQLFYASVTQGFKTGGINFFPPIKSYRPEKVTAYEAGSKSQFAQGAVELDAAAFYYDYTDLQLRTVVGTQAPISNVSKATIKGVELAFVARPVRDLTVDVNAAYVHSALKDYLSPATGTDLSGMQLPLSPRFSGTAGVQYRMPFGNGSALLARVEVNRQSSLIFPALQNPTIERRGPVTLVNANAQYTFADKRTFVSVIGRNLTNQTVFTNRNYSAGFADFETYGAPRTVEIRVGSRF